MTHKSNEFVSQAAATRDLVARGFRPSNNNQFYRTTATGEMLVATLRYFRETKRWFYTWEATA